MSQYSCGSFNNRIVYPESHPSTAPEFWIDNLNGRVYTQPRDRDDLGFYPLKIESCITIFSTGQEICTISEEFIIEVRDPCPFTSIVATGISTVMEAPQEGFDDLTLSTSIPAGFWPWFTQLDVEKGLVYGSFLCLDIEYDVFYDNQGVAEETSLVVLTQDQRLELRPTVNDPVGSYNMLLCGRLKFYGDIVECKPFEVQVIKCRATIVPPALDIIDTQYNMWYNDALPVFLGGPLSGFT